MRAGARVAACGPERPRQATGDMHARGGACLRKAIRQMLWHPELAGVRDSGGAGAVAGKPTGGLGEALGERGGPGAGSLDKLKVRAPEDLAKLPSAADALKCVTLSPGLLIQAGRGDRNKAPAELAAILGAD